MIVCDCARGNHPMTERETRWHLRRSSKNKNQVQASLFVISVDVLAVSIKPISRLVVAVLYTYIPDASLLASLCARA